MTGLASVAMSSKWWVVGIMWQESWDVGHIDMYP